MVGESISMRNIYATIDQSCLEPGDHLCFLYERDEDCQTWAHISLHQSLIHSEKILYVLDTPESEIAFQRSWARLPEIQAALQHGTLSLLDLRGRHDWHTCWERPDQFLRCFQAELNNAQRQGYSLLRVVINMTSSAAQIQDHLIHYETCLDLAIRQQPFALVCEYDQRQLSPDLQLNLVAHHRLIGIPGAIFENFYYIPTEECFSATHPDAILQHWLNNLAAYRQSQQDLWESSMRDPLTGFYNQAFFKSELDTMERTAPRTFSLVMVLVDHPEITLEGFDPRVAQEYLRRAATVLKSASRKTDIIARLDERQFAVLVPGGDPDTMEETVQRIRTALNHHNHERQRVPLNLFLWGASTRSGTQNRN